MLTTDQAREWLRIDGTDSDAIITALLSSAPSYIYAATGISEADQAGYPLCDTITRFLLTLWYDGEQAEAERLQTIISGLLKSLAALRTAGASA